MSDTVRVPEPVMERIEAEHERRGISRGAVVESWMQKAAAYEDMKTDFRKAMKTRGNDSPSLTGGRAER